MELITLLKYLEFAKAKNKILRITTRNNKLMDVFITEFTESLVKYKFANGNQNSSIKYENIINVEFVNSDDAKEFSYETLSEEYKTPNLKERLENLKKYYLELIDILIEKEKKDNEDDQDGLANLEYKKKIYPYIFERMLYDKDSLLLHYFTKNNFKKIYNDQLDKEILLIEQANISQKKAINNAFNERISIIEGPPGTGKTTTILNILANLIYRNKKVLVVSKNNSAINNVVEELEKINIPKCYVRMRKL